MPTARLSLLVTMLWLGLFIVLVPRAGPAEKHIAQSPPAASDAPPPLASKKIPLAVQAWGIPDGGQCSRPDLLGLGAYDGRTRTARYRCELLTAKSLSGHAKRRDNFFVDATWPREFRATLADYKSVADVYDRGHLHPAGDSPTTQAAMDATFSLSNMALEHKQLNRGPWKALEEELRQIARRDDVAGVWVVTCTLFAPEALPPQGKAATEEIRYHVAGPNHVPIPTHWAKAVLILGSRVDNPVALRAWALPNRAPQKGETYDTFRVPVDLVEHWSGLDFFADLPDDLEESLEAAK